MNILEQFQKNQDWFQTYASHLEALSIEATRKAALEGAVAERDAARVALEAEQQRAQAREAELLALLRDKGISPE